MKHTIRMTIGVLALLGTQACIMPVANSPWALSRGSQAENLARNQSQIRAQISSAEESLESGTPYAGVRYGATDDLTLGISVGESLKRASDSSQLIGEEKIGVTANYGFDSGSSFIETSAQLEVLFKELPFSAGPSSGDSTIEYRPSLAAHGEQFMGRVGVNLQERLDAQFQFDAAYWSKIGDYIMGVVEFDAGFGDIDEIYLTPSAVTQVRELVQLQMSLPIGLNSESSDWQALLGLVVRF